MIPYGVFKTKRFLLVFIVLGELLVSGLFFWYVYKRFFSQPKVLGAQTVAVIKKDNLVFPATSDLKYYYTLKPESVQEDTPSWLPSKIVNTINADGMNDRFSYSVEKPPATFRIVTLGDSFTFGQFVNTSDSWPEQLEDILNQDQQACGINRVEVLNLGVGGYDVAYIAEHYKTLGAKYNPDLIIWFESGSGFTRDNELAMPLIKDCQQKNTLASESAQTVSEYYRCWSNAENTIKQNYSPSERAARIRSKLSDFLASINKQKLVMFTFESSAFQNEELAGLKDWQNAFPNLNIQSTVPNIYQQKKVLPDSHPNRDGHAEIAKTVANYLHQTVLKKCESNLSF